MRVELPKVGDLFMYNDELTVITRFISENKIYFNIQLSFVDGNTAEFNNHARPIAFAYAFKELINDYHLTYYDLLKRNTLNFKSYYTYLVKDSDNIWSAKAKSLTNYDKEDAHSLSDLKKSFIAQFLVRGTSSKNLVEAYEKIKQSEIAKAAIYKSFKLNYDELFTSVCNYYEPTPNDGLVYPMKMDTSNVLLEVLEPDGNSIQEINKDAAKNQKQRLASIYKKFLNFLGFSIYMLSHLVGDIELIYLVVLFLPFWCWCTYIYETLSALFIYFVFVDNLGAWLVTYSLCVVMLKIFVFFVVPFYLWVLLLPRDNSPYRYKG